MMQLIELPPALTILVDIAAWFLFHLVIGWLTWRMPASSFTKDSWLFRQRPWEQSGRFYRKFLCIERWKRLMPEAGNFFPGGFSKRRLLSRKPQYLARFVLETKRGELTHWLSMLPAPLFFLWNPWAVGLCMIAYALVFNLPFIAINRFTRARLSNILLCRKSHFTEKNLQGERDRATGNGPCNRGPQYHKSPSHKGEYAGWTNA